MIQFNTDIDFIQTSGGILQDIDHIGFTPLGSGFLLDGDTPSLPSGSLWLRPNDGQIERLNYQGTSGIFEGKSAVGYAVYTTTTLQGPISSAGGPVSIDFETVIIEDSQYITQDSADTSKFRFMVDGLWRITYSLRFATPGDGTDGSVRCRWRRLNPLQGLTHTISNTFIATNADGGAGHATNDMTMIIKQRLYDLAVTSIDFDVDTDLVEGMVTFELVRPDSQDTIQ